MTISVPRRFALAACSLSLACVIFRVQVAAAIVTRGDDALRAGDRGAAVHYYQRALFIDDRSRTAADRLAFHLAMQHTARDARAAVDVASAALAHAPADPSLLADRGFAEQQLHHWPEAQDDLARAADAGNDPRYDHLAARVAMLRGRPAEARLLFARALLYDPRFDPARKALAHLP